MSPTAGSYEGEGVAERRAQRELTEGVGVTLVRRSRSHKPQVANLDVAVRIRRRAQAER
jgi:hypothetical protein